MLGGVPPPPPPRGPRLSPGERCTVEEVDRDRWLFLEGDGEGPQDLFRQGMRAEVPVRVRGVGLRVLG